MTRAALQSCLCLAALGLGLLVSACGKEESKTPTGTPSPSSGMGVISGVVSVVSGNCTTASGVTVRINSLTGNNVFSYLTPMGTTFETQLTPGDYILSCQATPCTFTQQFSISSGQALVIDPVL